MDRDRCHRQVRVTCVADLVFTHDRIPLVTHQQYSKACTLYYDALLYEMVDPGPFLVALQEIQLHSLHPAL